jgi:hypothetical protein
MDFATFKRKAKAGFGIDFSNESVKTRGSKHMKLREASFAGKIVICELHSKLTRQINRIHFHPPIDSVEKGKMLIGIFVDHLKT